MKIQATIGGFHGEPCTMISLLDERTGIIVISKTIKYRENRYAPDFALVSNLDLPELDMSFTDELLRDSIRSYFTRKAQLTLDVLTEVRRYEPDNCMPAVLSTKYRRLFVADNNTCQPCSPPNTEDCS